MSHVAESIATRRAVERSSFWGMKDSCWQVPWIADERPKGPSGVRHVMGKRPKHHVDLRLGFGDIFALVVEYMSRAQPN